jgi:hypothetical protein
MRYVFGDVHGAGKEFAALCSLLRGHQLFCVGDLFDRGFEASLVWQTIREHQLRCTMGNHERKMLQFLTGERPHLPPHYLYAMNDLRTRAFVTKRELIDFLSGLPLMIRLTEGNREVIIVHAGIDPQNPRAESLSWNVYGNDGCGPSEVTQPWWDRHSGDPLVVYGHLSQEPPYSAVPRIRRMASVGSTGMSTQTPVTSIGLDTCTCRGGPMTAYGLDDEAFVTYRTGTDWTGALKMVMTGRGKSWARELANQLRGDW